MDPTLLIFLLLLPIGFLPTIIAIKKNHPQKVPIILVNIFGGAFWGIGWFIAIVWVFMKPKESHVVINNESSSASEIEKLHELKEKGILSEEEFSIKKNALLND